MYILVQFLIEVNTRMYIRLAARGVIKTASCSSGSRGGGGLTKTTEAEKLGTGKESMDELLKAYPEIEGLMHLPKG